MTQWIQNIDEFKTGVKDIVISLRFYILFVLLKFDNTIYLKS